MDTTLDDDDKSSRELIIAVRCNRFLFDKNEKLYSNTNVKSNTWARIGASLTNPLEGHVAEKKFYYLRQRYGKERRKVLRSVTNSNAGTDQPTYNSTWVLYNELTFLEGFIKPRKRSSKSKVPTNSFTNSTLPAASVSDKLATTSSDLSNKSFTNTDKNLNICLLPLPATTSKVVQLRKIMPKIGIKRSPSDTPLNQEQENTEIVRLTELNEQLSNVAMRINQLLDRSAAASNTSLVRNTSSGIQPMLNAIEFALRVVPEHAQLQCLIDILQYINNFSHASDNNMIDSEGSH